MTAILYLNEGWEPRHGGELRLFHQGAENLKIKAEVEPLWNRLLIFWSDERCPHEVLSACRDRFAATVWYYDQTNPLIQLEEFRKGIVSGPPSSGPSPGAVGGEEHGVEAASDEPIAVQVDDVRQQALVFFDGDDQVATSFANSLDMKSPGSARLVNIRLPGAAEKLQASACPQLSKLLSEDSLDAFRAEAGSVLLVLPDGTVLPRAERQQWLAEYELEYARSVEVTPPHVAERLREKVFAPLDRLRSTHLAPDSPWWASPEAISVWGDALGKESFLVLDDFLPAEAAAALGAAAERIKVNMTRGLTDSELSAGGRGDLIRWVSPPEVPELDPLIEHLNALVSTMMEVQDPSVQARLSQVTALSDPMFAAYPGRTSDNARYIRHVDNEDGRNGRLLTCVFYMNEGWNAAQDGGEIRIFDSDQRTVKADLAPHMNRLVVFFSDSTVPHEVRRARRDRNAVTIWYINQEMHLAYHKEQAAQETAKTLQAATLVEEEDPQ